MTDDTLYLKLDNGVVIYSGEKYAGKSREDKNMDSKGHTKFHILNTPDHKLVSFIATGPNHLFFICEGKMYAKGDNTYKQLGIVVSIYEKTSGKRKYIEEPSLVMPQKDFVMAACSRKHTFFVTITGALYTAGTSTAGELGVYLDQNEYEVETPLQVQGINRVCDVATSDEHSMAVHYDTRELYGWGNQVNGRLGLGSSRQATVNSPTLIPIVKDGVKTRFAGVACGKDFSIAVDLDGNLWHTGIRRHEASTSGAILEESNQFMKIPDKGKKYEYIVATSNFAVAIEQRGNVSFIGDKKTMHSSSYIKKQGEKQTFQGVISIMKVPSPEFSYNLISGLSISCNVE